MSTKGSPTACASLLVLVGCAAAEEPSFRVACNRPGDTVTVTAERGKAVFAIASPRGIGEATITRQNAAWPTQTVLRLYLAGLESLTVDGGASKLTASVLSHSGFARSVDLVGAVAGAQRLDPGCLRAFSADGRPADGLPGRGGWFELTLPAPLRGDDVKAVKIRWIDFYR